MSDTTFNIKAFGAVGDGINMETGALQAAIDTCHIAGGGTAEDAARQVPEDIARYPEQFDASHYYYVCRVHQSIAVYNVGLDDGQLTYSSRCALAANSNARNLTLDPSGKYLLVASQDADCVECFRIDPQTGALELAHTQHAPCATDVAVI